ncbi:UNVERIFIED_ORG: hypothetical protein ABIC43_000679 [Variovorax guangxiensis]
MVEIDRQVAAHCDATLVKRFSKASLKGCLTLAEEQMKSPIDGR